MSSETDTDPLEGSSIFAALKIELKQEAIEPDVDYAFPTDPLDSVTEPLELNSTDAMKNPKTGLMVCLHCLTEWHPDSLSEHMAISHNYRRVAFKCSDCKLLFREWNELLQHKGTCMTEKRAKKKTIKQIIKETDNILAETELDTMICPICALELPKEALKEHLLTTHSTPEASVPCSICGKKLKTNLSLKEHVKLVHHAVEDSVECEQCGQKFSSLKYLANHKRNVHPTGNKSHICAVCGKQFKSRLCLHQHGKSVHPPPAAAVACPHCSKPFKSSVSLKQHLKVSHGDYRRNTAA